MPYKVTFTLIAFLSSLLSGLAGDFTLLLTPLSSLQCGHVYRVAQVNVQKTKEGINKYYQPSATNAEGLVTYRFSFPDEQITAIDLHAHIRDLQFRAGELWLRLTLGFQRRCELAANHGRSHTTNNRSGMHF